MTWHCHDKCLFTNQLQGSLYSQSQASHFVHHHRLLDWEITSARDVYLSFPLCSSAKRRSAIVVPLPSSLSLLSASFSSTGLIPSTDLSSTMFLHKKNKHDYITINNWLKWSTDQCWLGTTSSWSNYTGQTAISIVAPWRPSCCRKQTSVSPRKWVAIVTSDTVET